MVDMEQHLLGDSSRWLSVSVLLGWSYDMRKLQEFLTSRTFAPHWREFELNWVMLNGSDGHSPPAFNTIISSCQEAWASGRNDYFLMQPETSSWNKESGLGHYIRLLTMIVRENMASNGIWALAEGEQLQKHFESAYVVVSAMREEWAQKGKLYEHFKATNKGRYNQDLLKREQTRAVSSRTVLAKPAPSSKEHSQGSHSQNAAAAAAILTSNQPKPSLPIGNTNGQYTLPNGLRTSKEMAQKEIPPTQASNTGQLTDKEPHIKQETLAEKEENFLDSLDVELTKKKMEVRNNVPSPASPTVARKRANSDEHNAGIKRRRSDIQENLRTGRSAEFKFQDYHGGDGESRSHGYGGSAAQTR